ncbi:MAG: DUF3093 domain-containing protein [Actinobacteria bacterium]|nr:DUF3093 domain-containing protein [Actinomycetota bacterium]MCB8996190.1 DUF3093 domain-containing protein [Actinomycetota bacterium]MCB9413931.1 DUF3093 domain-containing protein [Actinomycetota bacterium]HRY09615.1 DUF3093 family protein [Candidatus Nanopelagicales bacterium]
MTYREVLRPPWWVYGVAVGLAALFSFTLAAAATVPVALVVFAIIVALSVWVVSRRRLEISVDDTGLRVGDESLARDEIARALPLGAPELRVVAGPEADTRAHLILRNLSTKDGVKIDLSRGPTPYWLVSSAHPEELAAALRDG